MQKPELKSVIAAQGTEDHQPTLQLNLLSKSAIRRNCNKQMALLKHEARLISDKDIRGQIFKIIRSSLAVIGDDYDQEELLEIAQTQIEFVRWAVSVELAGNKDSPSRQHAKDETKNLKSNSDIAARKKKNKAKT